MKSQSFLVTVYSDNTDVVLGHDTDDECDFTLSNAIETTLKQLNPNAGVFDVAIDTQLNHIISVATKNNKEKK